LDAHTNLYTSKAAAIVSWRNFNALFGTSGRIQLWRNNEAKKGVVFEDSSAGEGEDCDCGVLSNYLNLAFAEALNRIPKSLNRKKEL
jgi:hypothetical protein